MICIATSSRGGCCCIKYKQWVWRSCRWENERKPRNLSENDKKKVKKKNTYEPERVEQKDGRWRETTTLEGRFWDGPVQMNKE